MLGVKKEGWKEERMEGAQKERRRREGRDEGKKRITVMKN